MKNSILFPTILILIAVSFSTAMAHQYHPQGSATSVSIGIRGNSGSFYYSQQNYNRSVNYQRTAISYQNRNYGGQRSVYYGDYNDYRRPNVIYRQEGRRYVNDFPCGPVVVVPATNRYHRHYQGCGCRY
jgi:hypothetical protein